MKILINNHFENATQALKANRGRTFLTVMGVTIGIASITIVLSLAGGISRLFGGDIPSTNSPVAIVKSGNKKTGTNLLTESDSATTVNTLTEKDANDLGKITGVKAAPIAFLHTELRARDGKIDTQNAALIGSTGSLKDVANLQVAYGQFIDDTGGVIVGQQLSVDLFGTEKSIGNVIFIRNQPLTVVGVLKNIENPVSYLDINFNNAAIVPLSSIKKFTQGTPQIQQIIMTSSSHQNLASSIKTADTILQKNHDNDKNYRIVSGDEINEKRANLVSLFSVVLAIIGGISLLIGGIGIMNVMLVNVAERQREVGVRRAVGATSWDIINQFLIESAIIGLLGGIFGYILGLVGAHIISLYLPLTPYIYWQTAVLTIGISIVIGILSGVYPAAHATKRDPIESLKY
jgi:ABC superfamily ATP binding cassette transporter, membrane protein